MAPGTRSGSEDANTRLTRGAAARSSARTNRVKLPRSPCLPASAAGVAPPVAHSVRPHVIDDDHVLTVALPCGIVRRTGVASRTLEGRDQGETGRERDPDHRLLRLHGAPHGERRAGHEERANDSEVQGWPHGVLPVVDPARLSRGRHRPGRPGRHSGGDAPSDAEVMCRGHVGGTPIAGGTR